MAVWESKLLDKFECICSQLTSGLFRYVQMYVSSLSIYMIGIHFAFHTRGGGVTTIYAGTGCAIFGVPFFEQKINFGVSFLVKL